MATNALVSNIRDVIERYHLALDRREDGDVAAHKAVHEIMDLLNMPWIQGAARRRAEIQNAM